MKTLSLFTVLILAMIAVALFATKSHKDKQSEIAQPTVPSAESLLGRSDVPTIGTVMAKVEIVEFFDPACEGCRAFHPYVKSVLEANNAKIQLKLRYAPFHTGSDRVSMLLEAARLQGMEIYVKVLERLLETQPQWADHARPKPDMVWELLSGTGIDLERARTDVESPAIKAHIRRDMDDLLKLDVRRTPTFFINGKPLRDFSPEGFSKQVAEEIRHHYQ